LTALSSRYVYEAALIAGLKAWLFGSVRQEADVEKHTQQSMEAGAATLNTKPTPRLGSDEQPRGAGREWVCRFFERIFDPAALADHHFCLRTVPGQHLRWFPVANMDRASAWTWALSRRERVFVSTGLVEREPDLFAGEKPVVSAISSIWLVGVADDQSQEVKLVERWRRLETAAPLFEVPPSLHFAMGHRHYAGWLLKEPLQLNVEDSDGFEALEAVVHGLAESWQCYAAGAGCDIEVAGSPHQLVPVPWVGKSLQETGEFSCFEPIVSLADSPKRHAYADLLNFTQQTAPIIEQDEPDDKNDAELVKADADETIEEISIDQQVHSEPVSAEGQSHAAGTFTQHAPPCQPPVRLRWPELNKPLLTNHTLTGARSNGAEAVVAAVGIDQLARQLLMLVNDKLCHVDGQLLAVDGTPKRFVDSDSFFAWLQRYVAIGWRDGIDARGINFVSRQDLFSYLRWQLPAHSGIELFPLQPPPAKRLIHWRQPVGYLPNLKYLQVFVNQLQPASEADACLLRSLVMSLLWSGPAARRPVFRVAWAFEKPMAERYWSLAQLLSELLPGAVVLNGEPTDVAADVFAREAQTPMRLSAFDVRPREREDVSTQVEAMTQCLKDQLRQPACASRMETITTCVEFDDSSEAPALQEDVVTIRLRGSAIASRRRSLVEISNFITAYRDRILADALKLLRGGGCLSALPTAGRVVQWIDDVLARDPMCHAVFAQPLLPDQATSDGARASSEASTADQQQESDAPPQDAPAEQDRQPEDEVSCFIASLEERMTRGDIDEHSELSPAFLADLWNQSCGSDLSVQWVMRKIHAAKRAGKLPMLARPASKKSNCWHIEQARNHTKPGKARRRAGKSPSS
jgi:hypothetical protein